MRRAPEAFAIVLLAASGGCTALLGDFSEGPGSDGGALDGSVNEGDADAGAAGETAAPVEGGGRDATAVDTGAFDVEPKETGATCTPGSVCTPADCQLGVSECNDAGAQTCSARGQVTNGTGCGDGGVCYNGGCSPCAAGADCSEAGTCKAATIACGTGQPVCTPAGNAANGASCGVNDYCDDGVCQACTNGAPCVPPAAPCDVGSIACADGGISCSDTGSKASDGTSCGTNMVCKTGQCVSCTAGASCTPAACQTGITSCTTGAQTCAQTGTLGNGTPCGTNQVCDNGVCSTCSSGAACNPGGNVCLLGTTDCSTGAAVCTQTGAAPPGTACPSGVCDGSGNCGACTAGQSCNPGGNPCQTGTISCSTGMPVCGNASDVMNGTSCGTNMVCYQGSCDPCTTGSCSPGGNTCQTGTTSCSTGQPVCSFAGDVGDGTSCNSNAGICCSGTCEGCSGSPPSNGYWGCVGGACAALCSPGYTMCSNACVNVSTDDGDCGSCGHVCVTTVGYTCSNGSCVCLHPLMCGSHDCGCEVGPCCGASCPGGC